jgi:hypothetical protein
MIRLSIASVLCVLAAACGGAGESAKPQDPKPQPAVSETPRDVCVSAFTHQRECGEVFLPALVAKRVELDVPAGIAAKDAAEGREAILTVARAEFAEDSTDEAIGATCDSLAQKIPVEQQAQMTEQAKACDAETDCQAFTDCMIPFISQQWPHPE